MDSSRQISKGLKLKILACILLLSACQARPNLDQWAPPQALQTVYRNGVPHTDRIGHSLEKYDPGRSFLPIGLYHALSGQFYGRTYGLKAIANAGFNTVLPWEGQPLDRFLKAANKFALQTIVHRPQDKNVTKYRQHTSVLAWYLNEEPTGIYNSDESVEQRQRFNQRRKNIRRRPAAPLTPTDVQTHRVQKSSRR